MGGNSWLNRRKFDGPEAGKIRRLKF